MKKRIIGIDVARALAVIGMIIVNFKIVFGEHGESWLKSFAHLFDGKAAATFVVLAGIGLSLMTRSAIQGQNQATLQIARWKIFKRAIFLFVIGLSYIWIWPADILHFYGIYMLVALLFIHRPARQVLIGSIGFILTYPLLIILFNYETGWDFTTLEYLDFWTLDGFFRNLFYNGFHPVFPWVAFMLFGMWYGRQNLHDDTFLKKSLWISLSVFILIQIISASIIQFTPKYDSQTEELALSLFGTNPMPPMPIYMINGISISIAIISFCIILAKRYESNIIIQALHKTGKLALTFYVAHVILGMGMVEEISPIKLGEYSIHFSVTYALLFSLLCILFANIWLQYKRAGPLEWLMRKLIG